MQDYKKIDYSKNKDVVLRYVPGHFITPNSHVNYYMDLSDMKARQREARATGEELAEMYLASDVIDTILFAAPQRIVYVSCNPATQARDLQLLDTDYRVARVQPVDMFPHTQHVENVVLLERRVEK